MQLTVLQCPVPRSGCDERVEVVVEVPGPVRTVRTSQQCLHLRVPSSWLTFISRVHFGWLTYHCLSLLVLTREVSLTRGVCVQNNTDRLID